VVSVIPTHVAVQEYCKPHKGGLAQRQSHNVAGWNHFFYLRIEDNAVAVVSRIISISESQRGVRKRWEDHEVRDGSEPMPRLLASRYTGGIDSRQ
jgi:hypothetical protein